MSRKAPAVVLITMMLPVMGTLTTSTSAQNQTGTSVGVTCAYFSGSPFGTEVLNVEIEGLSSSPVTRGMPCAAAARVLMDLGFAFVEMGPRLEGDFNGNGAVDAADYVVWRKRSGSPRPRPSTTVITACAHFNGPAISTELIGVDHAGPQQPPFVTGKSCAAAFGDLTAQGFEPLYKGPRVALDINGDSNVDAADYVVWRCQFGCP